MNELHEAMQDPRSGMWPGGTGVKLVGAGLVLMALYLATAGASTLWDRDEPRYARASVEMLERGDWLVPKFNNELRPHKPGLIYWAMAGSIAAFGKNEVAVRLPSAVGMAGAAMLTFWIGVRLFNRRVGWWAMWMFGTSALVMYMGSAAMTDGILMLCILGAIAVFVSLVTSGGRWWHWAGIAVLMGLGQLTKGPVGLAVPALTIAAAPWLGRAARRQGMLQIGSGWGWKLVVACAASVGVFALWGIPANLATAGEFAEKGLGEHVIHRIFNPMEGHGGEGLTGYLATISVYVPIVIGLFFPWTLLLPGGVRAMLGRRLGGPVARAVIWAWIVPTFVMMSLVATKLPHYILPIFPALAIVAAGALDRRVKMGGDRGEADSREQSAGDGGPPTLNTKDRDWLRGGVWFFGPVAGLVVAGLAAGPFVLKVGVDGWAMWGIAAAVGAVAAAAIRWQLRERVARAAALLAVATPLILVGGAWAIMPTVERALKPSPALAAAARQVVGREGPVYIAGAIEEDSLTYYLDLRHDVSIERIEDPEHIARWAANEEAGVLILTDEFMRKVEASVGAIPVETIARRAIINYSKGGRRQVYLVVRPEG